MSIFTKPISQISPQDLHDLLEQRAAENVRLEFKREVPSKDELLKKLSSFANTFGGFLLRMIVRPGDAIGDPGRSPPDAAFDAAIGGTPVRRAVLVELASLDGAVVMNNSSVMLAFGAVLRPKKSGRSRGSEGSRTKAAIGASFYGLAVKVSSDGDITVYHKGKQFICI
jgi:hypothetical protein